MKKTILFTCIYLLSTFVLAADFSSLNCDDASILNYKSGTLSNSTAYQCTTCFKTTDLYYRAGYPIENITNLYDTFDVVGVSPRIMWTDETWVDWDVLNNKFTIGSDLSTTRSDAKGFKFEDISVSDSQRQPFWQTANNAPNTGRIFGIFYPSDPLLSYVRSPGGISLDNVSNTATSSDRSKPMWRIAFNAASRATNIATGVDGSLENHIQCAFVFPKWCGDGTLDSDKSEQCDDGNMTSGDGCSNTCTTEASLSCTNLTLSPTTLTKNGGSLSATCAASVSSGTQYKLVLKQGATTLETIDYQSLATKTFAYSLPANGSVVDKTYSVECFVKNGAQTNITSAACNKNITVPGTVTEAAVCNSLTLSTTSAQINTPINYSCSATNATSYIIKQGGTVIGTLPDGTINFPTAGTYSIGCFIDGQTTTPVPCAKNITITNPPPSTIPSVFIDKDDSTPGTPDTDGNDIQRVQNNGTATFTIRFLNNGNEALKTVVIEDPLAGDCARTTAQTASLYAGGATTNFDVGESFTYQCTRSNVTSSTFPSNRNTITIKGVGVTSGQNVTDSDITEIFIRQTNPSISVEKDDTDDLDDKQEIDKDGTAKFSVKVTNDGDESLENVEITDELSRDCERDESETRNLIKNIGNRDSLFDPGETFAYTCKETSVDTDTFPDETNTVCVGANGVDTDGDVDDCDETKIIVNDTKEENLVCEGIESSGGTFGGAPFRTTITCEVPNSDSECVIEVRRDGDVVNTYNSCTRSITFDKTGEYSVACIVDDEESSECAMDISIESMTDVPTGAKIIIIALLSLLLSAFGIHFYKKRAT